MSDSSKPDLAKDNWALAALEGSDLAAWSWDVAADRVELSISWSELLGETRRLTITSSKNLAALVHPDDLPQVMSVLESAVRGRSPAYDVEHRVRTASGSYRWIQSRGKVLKRDAAGHALLVTGTNADITARRHAEDMLAARELQLRLVVDSVPAMIVEVDADDRIRYANRTFADYFGIEPETVAGQTIGAAVGAAAYERFSAHSERMRRGERIIYERVLVRPGRPDAQLLIRIVPRMHRGYEYLGCYVMLEDVTESRHLERMKEEFINTVSHELRTPLNSIRASLDRIAAGGPAQDLAEVIATARSSCERLVRLVTDILDLQRLRAGQPLPGRAAPLVLADEVRAAAAANESLASEAGVALKVDAPAAPILVAASADRLAQLVTNLVANALKHSSRGGSVDISIERLERSARVSVRDYGPGVPADFEPQLFQKFTHGQAADGKQRGGTGLGLAISKAIAEQMNGRVGFAPADGPGAVFWFELPLA